MKKKILFGAGKIGDAAYELFDEGQVAYYVDNNLDNVGNTKNGVKIIGFDDFKRIHKDYDVVVSVGKNATLDVMKQLKEAGIGEFTTYQEIVIKLKRPQNKDINYLECCDRARKWIYNNSIKGEGIINNTGLPESYPEVTGYYIPTLINWGEHELARTYTTWLCSIQHEDGAWYDTEGKAPYVFDSAQILKGLLAAKQLGMDVDDNIKAGCEWIIKNINQKGRLTTPTKDAWGAPGICSELIHLYCLSPLIEAGKIYNNRYYIDMADKVAKYYIDNYREDILGFGFLSHFYAYVMEALCDIGQTDLAREAMHNMENYQHENGMVPAYKDVEWTCSTGMFQLAITWYKLGELEKGNKTFEYAMRLQNESGGWYGSYTMTDNPNPFDRNKCPDYFPQSEISWAVKYFLDALYYKCRLEFETQAPLFKSNLAKDDGRYQVVLNQIKGLKRNGLKIADVGCGKGCYIKNLLEDVPDAQYFAVDLSEKVMKSIPKNVEKKQGILTNIPYADNSFDITYTTEALEHAVYTDNALKELIRITKPDGIIIVIDKNKEKLGALEIDNWEQWFDNDFFSNIAKDNGLDLEVIPNVSYEEYIDIDELDRDLRRLSELSDGEVHHINILGGEPLLHPEIARIVEMVRHYFLYGNIYLVTNGVLLNRMDERFWKACKQCNIVIAPTQYPVKLDYEEIKNNVIAHGIQYQSFGQAADGWYHTVISESGDKNEIQQFLHCSNANNCTVLEHGKLYPCPKAAKVRHFNKAFGDRFQQSSHDYIDIYKAESLKEIMEFLSKPIPFCRYCDTFASEKIEWGVSHKEDSEWT